MGSGPVHPTDAAYRAIRDNLTEVIVSHMAEVRVKAAAVEEVKNHPVAAEVKQKPVKQDTRSRRFPVSPMQGVDSTYR